MWAYATATLLQALRSPVTWVLGVLAVFAGWFSTSAAILDLTRARGEREPLILSTAHLAGVLLALWLIGRALEEDRHSGFASAADAAAPGVQGRLMGRWIGASIAGVSLSVLSGLMIGISSSLQSVDPISLLVTSILAVCVVGAWAVFLGSVWRGGGATLAVFLLWVVAHLPWGVAPFLDGWSGNVLAALLPGPRQGALGPAVLGYTSAAVAGLLLVTLALSRPADT